MILRENRYIRSGVNLIIARLFELQVLKLTAELGYSRQHPVCTLASVLTPVGGVRRLEPFLGFLGKS